jgi:MG2 domain
MILLMFLLFSLSSKSQDVDWLQQQLSGHALKVEHKKVYIHIDRQIYTPKDKVWFQVYVLDSRTLKPFKGKETLTLHVTDSRNTELRTVTTEITNGTSSGSVSLPASLKEGIYNLEIEKNDDGEPYRVTFGVRKKAIPSFIISLETTAEKLIPGTNFTATLRFTNRSTEPLKKVDFEFYLNDGSGEKLLLSDKSDASGIYRINISLPNDLPSGLLGFGINANYRGETEILQGALHIASQNVFVRLSPEGGNLLAGTKNKIAYQAIDAYGNPFPFTGDLFDENQNKVATVKSDDTGLGSFEFIPEVTRQYSLRITLPYPIDKTFSLPAVASEGISIRLGVRKEKSAIVDVFSAHNRPFKGILVAKSGDRVIWSSQATENAHSYEVPLENVEGFVDFVFLNDAHEIESTRSILWKMPQPLPVNVVTDKTTYQPREEVAIKLSTLGAMKPLHISFSAAFQNWTSAPKGFQWVQYPEDLADDVLTYWGLQNAKDAQETDVLTALRQPSTMSWSHVLDTKSSLPLIASCPENIISNHNFNSDTNILYDMANNNGVFVYKNVKAENYFLVGNSEYLRSLNPRPVSRADFYKEMLENGTPVRDVVRKLRPYDLEGGMIIFPGRRTSLLAQNGAIVVVDGIIVGNSVAQLDQISPYDVDRIFVSTDPQDIQRYTGLNSVGLIEITLKHGPKPNEKNAKDTSADFESPVHKQKGRLKGGMDFRNTLYWMKMLSEDDTVNFQYYNGDLVGTVVAAVILMDENGRFGYATITYDIKL